MGICESCEKCMGDREPPRTPEKHKYEDKHVEFSVEQKENMNSEVKLTFIIGEYELETISNSSSTNSSPTGSYRDDLGEKSEEDEKSESAGCEIVDIVETIDRSQIVDSGWHEVDRDEL